MNINFKIAIPQIIVGCMLLLVCTAQSNQKQTRFNIVENKADQRIDITIDGQPFTSYIYPDGLMKPVLFPLRTAKGTLITRGWPLEPRSGERVDHPHHVGVWFNYGNVNGLDFWNNSTAIPADRKAGYGTIKHVSVNKMHADHDKATLTVTKDWQTPHATSLIKEETTYIFTQQGDQRAIELITKLTALDEDVSFKDNKEGLLGIRIARELEHPADRPELFTDANGIIAKVEKMNNDGVTGKYRSSEGAEGDDVWGSRAKWVNLMGQIGDESISLVILDNPGNVGYPTYWHARGYGLFAANPLGHEEFSKGKEVLDFKLKAGQSVVFKYKVLISSGSKLSDDQVNMAFDAFSSATN